MVTRDGHLLLLCQAKNNTVLVNSLRQTKYDSVRREPLLCVGELTRTVYETVTAREPPVTTAHKLYCT